MPLRNDDIRRVGRDGSSPNRLGLNVLNLRGGSDENEPTDKKEEIASPADIGSDAQKSGWFKKKEEPQERNDGYVEFTMNSDGKTANIQVQAPALQHELNKTLNDLNELQEKIKEEEASAADLISANGVANGGAAASGHMSAKFPITREELPHFACMSVLMFLFIYVFTTGELFLR